jgi:hypothetical protein
VQQSRSFKALTYLSLLGLAITIPLLLSLSGCILQSHSGSLRHSALQNIGRSTPFRFAAEFEAT